MTRPQPLTPAEQADVIAALRRDLDRTPRWRQEHEERSALLARVQSVTPPGRGGDGSEKELARATVTGAAQWFAEVEGWAREGVAYELEETKEADLSADRRLRRWTERAAGAPGDAGAAFQRAASGWGLLEQAVYIACLRAENPTDQRVQRADSLAMNAGQSPPRWAIENVRDYMHLLERNPRVPTAATARETLIGVMRDIWGEAKRQTRTRNRFTAPP